MTDEQIIKALECCTMLNCKNCPLWAPEITGSCVQRTMFGTIGLIKRQKAEIEKLKEELADARYLNTVAEHDGIKEFAERLKERVAFEAQDQFMIVTRTRIDGWIDDIVEEMTEGE